MIKIHFKDSDKVIRKADIKVFKDIDLEEVVWIDLFAPTSAEKKAVEDFLGTTIQSRQKSEEIESTSKYFETENTVFSNSNFFMPSEEGFLIEPVSFLISWGVLVSVRSLEIATIEEVSRRLRLNKRAFPTAYHIFIAILESRIDFDADLIEALSRNIAIMGKEISADKKATKETIMQINLLQENTMMIRENLFDRQRVLSGILRSALFPTDISPKLSLMIKDVNSLINHTDFNSERLDFMQETVLGLISLEQNNVTKIFTMAALFFMPPTMVASVYGMNFKFMPELAWKLGYPFAIGLMLFFAVGTYLLFRWKKWI